MKHTARRRARPELLVWAIALAAFGCSSFGTEVVGGDASVDGMAADAVINTGDTGMGDGGVADVPGMDADVPGMDAPGMDAPGMDGDVAVADGSSDGGNSDGASTDGSGRCMGNGDCVGNPAGPVCDTASGMCVPCQNSPDSCPDSQHCDTSSHACIDGCHDDMGCMADVSDGGTSDGGSTARYCNVAAHTCVQCVTDTQCPSGMLCTGNVCVVGCGAGSLCPAGQTCCGTSCVDTTANVANCGTCGAACSIPMAMPVCTAGSCAVGTCSAPFADCNGRVSDGCEVNTSSDLANCGACGSACPVRPNSTPTCGAGHCGFTCVTGFADCNGDPADGCESNQAMDPANCGACGNACNLPNVASATCTGGRCGIGMCAPGFADCNGNPADGCEANLATDSTHCGSCARACTSGPNAVPVCTASACVQTCIAGYIHCSSNPADGCEIDDRTDARNCGGCGRLCAPANGTGACVAGACGVTMCNPGFADCNHNPADGCEVNIETSGANCGSCGNTCGVGQVCSMGVCGSVCMAGQSLCGTSCANLQTDAANCGACGHACPAGNVCVAGACTLVCPAGQVACAGLCVSTATDTHNCGTCGMVCPAPPAAVPTCIGGACGFACVSGFADCNHNPTDGCEVNTGSSLANCGGCGMACAPANATGVCNSGACGIATCNPGYADCNGRPDDGCEVNTGTDAANCGGCGRACMTGQTCAMSICTSPPGVLTVTTPTVINTTAASINGAVGGTTVTISHTMGTFVAGQRVLMHQTQSSGADAGQYEYNTVAAVSGATVSVTTPLTHTYTTAGTAHAQMIVVGVYDSVNVEAAGSLTAPPWNGNTGGILAMDVRTSTTVAGAITMDGRGFRGAHHHSCMPRDNCTFGVSGESVDGPGVAGLTPNQGGGGGGGQGQDCGAGAGGSYGSAGAGGSVGDCNGGTWGQCAPVCPNPGGIAGIINGLPTLRAAFYLGSAGGEGGGDEDGAYPGYGGNGGGAIVIRTDALTVTGRVSASGAAGANGNSSDCGIASGCGMGGGGGGSGGAVEILSTTAATLGANLVRATGAGGGICSCGIIVGPERAWPAGRGGDGRIDINASSASGTTSPAYNPS